MNINLKQPMTILLVEDDEIAAEAVQRAFRKQKINNPFVVAGDGVEALEILRGEHADITLKQPFVVLLDLNMPRMDGYEFLSIIRQDDALKTLLVFVLTTAEDEVERTKAYQHYISGFLSKREAGTDFLNVIRLLEQFEISIQFPPNITM